VRAQCPARPRLPTSQPSHITKTRRRAWRSFLGEHRPAGRPSSRRGEQAGEAALGPHVGPSPCSAGLATGGGCFLRGRRGLLWVKGALAAHRDYRGQGGRDLRRSYLAWATGRSGGKGGLLILVLGQGEVWAKSGGQVGVGEQAYLAYLAYLVAYLARNRLAWATGRSGGKGGLLILVLGQDGRWAKSGGQVGVGEQAYLAYLAYLVAHLAYLAYLARNHLAWATGRVGRGRPGRSCLVLRTYSWRRSPLGSSRCTSLALS